MARTVWIVAATLLLSSWGAPAWAEDPTPDLQWVKAEGDKGVEDAWRVTALPDGGTITTGAMSRGNGATLTFGQGEASETTFPLATYGSGGYLLKHDASGNLVWARSIEGGNNWGLGAFPDGSFVVVGTAYQDSVYFWDDEGAEMGLSVAKSGTERTYVARYAADGTVSAAFLLDDGTEGTGIAAFPDGSFAITGTFQGSATFGTGGAATTLTSTLQDVFVARYHADETLAWARSAGASGARAHAEVHAAALPGGTVAVAGQFLGTLDFGPGVADLSSVDGWDAFVACYDDAGTCLWAQRHGGTGTDMAAGVAGGPDGTVAVTGVGDGGEAFFLVRYNADGTLAWESAATAASAPAGASPHSEGSNVAFFLDGTCVASGKLTGTATFGGIEISAPDEPLGGEVGFVVRYLADGTAAWAATTGGNGYSGANTQASGLATLPDGTFLVTGTFLGTVTIGAGDAQEATFHSTAYQIVVGSLPFGGGDIYEDVPSLDAYFARYRAYTPAQDLVSPSNPVAELQVESPTGGTVAVEVDFSGTTIDSAGVVSVEAALEGPELPAGYKLGDAPVWYDVSTTSTYSGTLTLCFSWNEGDFANEGNIALFHYEDGAWVDITTSLDTVGNSVCGTTTSLSPFVLAEVSYVFGGIQSPVDPDGASIFKLGQTIPLKFSLQGPDGEPVTDAVASLRLYYVTSSILGTVEQEVDVASVGNANTGSLFRYDDDGDVYVFNLSTKHRLKGTYEAVIHLDDGSFQVVPFSLR